MREEISNNLRKIIREEISNNLGNRQYFYKDELQIMYGLLYQIKDCFTDGIIKIDGVEDFNFNKLLEKIERHIDHK